jgi:LVIVD repeat
LIRYDIFNKSSGCYNDAVLSDMNKLLLFFLVNTVLLSSCWNFGSRPSPPVKKVWGYRPVYSSDPALLAVKSEAPRPIKNAGKIYVKDNIIFQNDIGYGIHVIDNSNPAQPKQVGFIRVTGSSEMSITGNYMYVNSSASLVVADLSDWQNVREVKRIPNAFQQGYQGGAVAFIIPPPEHNVYYECLNYYDGVHTGWIRDSVYNNNCHYP